MSIDLDGDLTTGENGVVDEIAERIRWTPQGWPVPQGLEDGRVLQSCYSWLAWQDLPLAMVPKDDSEFDEFVSSNIFLAISFDGRDLKSLGFVTRDRVEALGRRPNVTFVPAAFGAEKMLLRLKAFNF
ncbi:hypothetical protein [Methanocrinis sp.]|uniref:hypothetical protein n=1 Tax=Methanocrinis sp. TaxID=3101522 RepID=UPI003D1054CA